MSFCLSEGLALIGKMLSPPKPVTDIGRPVYSTDGSLTGVNVGIDATASLPEGHKSGPSTTPARGIRAGPDGHHSRNRRPRAPATRIAEPRTSQGREPLSCGRGAITDSR